MRPGALRAFPDNEELQGLGRKIYDNGGIVCSVWHGAVDLRNTALAHATLLMRGKQQVTGFSNKEERRADLDRFVPYLTEVERTRRGTIYKKAGKPWLLFAVEDLRLIAGQNPASGGTGAELVVAQLGG